MFLFCYLDWYGIVHEKKTEVKMTTQESGKSEALVKAISEVPRFPYVIFVIWISLRLV